MSSEPERPSVTRAALRYWPVVLLPTIALVVAALLFASDRSPTYSAESRLIIGGLDVESRAVPGFVEATKSLTQTYSRSVTGEHVVAATARKLGTTPAKVRAHLSATGIPDSAVLKVKATGPSAAEAERTADAASAALIDYIGSLSGAARRKDGLLDDYESAALAMTRAERKLELLRAKVLKGAGPATRRAFERAGVKVQTQRLRVRTLGNLYGATDTPTRTHEALSVLSPATDATSDKSSFTQRAVFVALVAGLALGLLMAMALDARRRGRTARAGAEPHAAASAA